MLIKFEVCGAFSRSLKRMKVNPTATTTAAANPASISFPRSLKSVPVSSISAKTQIEASKRIIVSILQPFAGSAKQLDQETMI